MGQAVRVVQKRRLDASTLRFEVNRSLTGMAHVAFFATPTTDLDRPTSVMATRMFEAGLIKSVQVFSNLITVTEARSLNNDEESVLDSIVEDLFIHYLPGVEPTPIPTAETDPPPETVTE